MSEHTPRKLIFVDATDEQVRWGGNDDPRGILHPGKAYAVASVDVRSSHTKVELVAFPGKRFNSVCFKQEHAAISGIDPLRAVNAELLAALWVATEHNALHFGEQHNTVIQGRAAIAKANALKGDSHEQGT